MHYKKKAISAKLLEAARSRDRYRDVHVFIGGTGAVGGGALFQMLSLYEDMLSINPATRGRRPILVATGHRPEDLKAFTGRLYKFSKSRWGADKPIEHPESSVYVTPGGIEIRIARFKVDLLPALAELRADASKADKAAQIRKILEPFAKSDQSGDQALFAAVREAPLMSRFLKAVHGELLSGKRKFRSVTIGIPIPSLIAYHQEHLFDAARAIDVAETENDLKECVVNAFRDDMKRTATLADAVLIAHTTGVGGMYDEDANTGEITVRLGFAHAGRDQMLIQKQRFAEQLTTQYASVGVKMLITAAAIGIDEIKIRRPVPLHSAVVKLVENAPVFKARNRDKQRDAAGPIPKKFACLIEPAEFPLEGADPKPLEFNWGKPICPQYSIRSGENGFFSIANADALYRVMRVASASELGLTMATVGLFGDDEQAPWFKDNVCYYTETDNSRQVFDLLNRPEMQAVQLSGLEPMALQDLGSAKHQAELHTLGLLILLHRLRTLDIDAVDPYTDVEKFDPARFFVEYSRPLTFEDITAWTVKDLARDLRIIASANTAMDLATLKPALDDGRFTMRDEARRLVLKRVLDAAWMPHSLGSPVLFERDGASYLRAGFFAAPLGALVGSTSAIVDRLRDEHKKNGNPCSFEEFRDFHICASGFIDLRASALLTTAKSDAEDLTGKVLRFRDEASLRSALSEKVAPYSQFSTNGLVALLLRLKALGGRLREAMAELGTLHDYRWQMPRDSKGHILVVPGAVEAFRMVSEGLGKTTGTEYLDGPWGYERSVRRPIKGKSSLS